MFDPIDIAMLFSAGALAFKGVTDYFDKKAKLEKHKKQLKDLTKLIEDKKKATSI